MKVVDGSRGEGGGQVARVALSLAAATRQDVRIENVRAGRDQPGLKASHAASFRAIAEVCDGEIEGAEIGSRQVTLRPGVVAGGDYSFAIETAGPITLLLQAVLPALAASRQPFALALRGGTNVAWAPQWDDFVHVHAANLRRIGIEVDATLHRRGFFPQGGGEARVEGATPSLRRVDLTDPGDVRRIHAMVPSHGLPRHVMERASLTLMESFRDTGHPAIRIETDFHRGPGTGMAVAIAAECANATLGGDAVGRKGVRVEDVVAEAADPLKADLAANVGVDVHQADQLPVFMALAGGGSYTCRRLSDHARTVLDLIPEFLPVRCETTMLDRGVRVDVRGA